MVFVDSPAPSAVNLGSFQLFAILWNSQIKLSLKYGSHSGLIFPLARSGIIKGQEQGLLSHFRDLSAGKQARDGSA